MSKSINLDCEQRRSAKKVENKWILWSLAAKLEALGAFAEDRPESDLGRTHLTTKLPGLGNGHSKNPSTMLTHGPPPRQLPGRMSLLRRPTVLLPIRAMIPDPYLALLVGYLLGSIPFGLVLTRLSGKGDLRAIGSGNIGATNVLRTGSKPLAATTLLLDAAKGALAVVLAQRFWPDAVNYAAAGALVGHLYPVWLKFRGGKGVATLLGILVPLFPLGAAVYAAVWVALLIAVRISSLAGMAAAASAPLAAAIGGERALFPMLLAFAMLIVWKHRENVQRLKAGTEPRIGRRA